MICASVGEEVEVDSSKKVLPIHLTYGTDPTTVRFRWSVKRSLEECLKLHNELSADAKDGYPHEWSGDSKEQIEVHLNRIFFFYSHQVWWKVPTLLTFMNDDKVQDSCIARIQVEILMNDVSPIFYHSIFHHD